MKDTPSHFLKTLSSTAAILLCAYGQIPLAHAQTNDLETPPPNITLTEGSVSIDIKPQSSASPTPTPSPTPSLPSLPKGLTPILPPAEAEAEQESSIAQGIPAPTPVVSPIKPSTPAPLNLSPQVKPPAQPATPPPVKLNNPVPPSLPKVSPTTAELTTPEDVQSAEKELIDSLAKTMDKVETDLEDIKPNLSPVTKATPAPAPKVNPTPLKAPTAASPTNVATASPTPVKAPLPPALGSKPASTNNIPQPPPQIGGKGTPTQGLPTPLKEAEGTPVPTYTAKTNPAPVVPPVNVVPPITPVVPAPVIAPIPVVPTTVDTTPQLKAPTDAINQPDGSLKEDMGQIATELLPTISDKTPEDVEAILRELEEKTKQSEVRRTVETPNLPKDEHVYENVPLSKVLRLLAEQAGINYIEPDFKETDAPISFRLQKMTPLEAFMRVAESRGFRVVTRNEYTTVTRPDLAVPTYLVTRKYPLRHSDPMWVVQSVANLLGVKLDTPGENLTSYPTPQDTSTDSASSGGGGGGGGGATGLNLGNVGIPDNPRWTPSLPFDAPLSKGQTATAASGGGQQETSVFVDRRSNAIVVKASEEEQMMVEKYIAEIDRPEPQIMIEAKIIEISLDDEFIQGIDWSKPFGPGDANGLRFGLMPTGGAPGDPVNIATFTQSAIKFLFTPTTLFMDSSSAEIVIRNFQTFRIGSVVSEPRVVTKTGVPVTIRSTIVENIPVLTPQANTGATTAINSTEFESFTTGLAMDVVPRLLANGEVELNINPTVASEIGRTAPTAEIPSGVPIISQRILTTTATVRAGMTVIIGGLNAFDSKKGDTGVPPLNRFPFLGNTVFGDKTRDKAKRTLMVFVTPRIVYPNQYEKVYVNESENNQILESQRNNPTFVNDRKPQAVEIRKAQPVRNKLNVQ